MALRKRRAGKGAAKKAAGKSKPRKRAAGKGHNKPPEDPPSVPPISSWYTDDQSAAQVVRQAAYRQRQYLAAIGSGPVAPPFALAHDPSVLHAEMLKRVAALEEATARLLTSTEGQIKPRPLDDNDIEEIKSAIETLKKMPPVPARPPPEAVGAQSRVASLAEKILVSLAADTARRVITAASKVLWTEYGDRLTALARAIGEWIANLPP